MTVPPAVARLLPVVVAVLLVGGVVGLAVVDEDDGPAARDDVITTVDVAPTSTVPGESTTTTAASPDLSGKEATPELTALVRELQAFVEKERGLKFTGPVRVTLLGDKEFKAKLAAKSEGDKEQIDRSFKILRALDLIDEDVDLEKAVQALLAGAVLGYYDLEEKALFVRGAKITPAVRQTLVHELTHALQDQHFDVHRPELDEQKDESSQAFTGLVEGDASVVEDAYVAKMSAADRRAAEREQLAMVGDLDAVPRVLLQALIFPYTAGPPFVRALVSAGGQGRRDAAFGSPPLTSEHLIHPDRFLTGERPLAVTPPPVPEGGKELERGVFGELGFLQQLESAVPDQTTLLAAAAGWGGDGYVAYTSSDGRTCVRVDTVMDTPRDADELSSALRRWVADGHSDAASVSGGSGSPLVFTSCA